MIEGAQAGAAVHAPVGHRTISEGEVNRAAVQAGLRFVKRVVVKDAVCGLNSVYGSLKTKLRITKVAQLSRHHNQGGGGVPIIRQQTFSSQVQQFPFHQKE